MSQLHSSEALKPYLNHQYWDGHMLGGYGLKEGQWWAGGGRAGAKFQRGAKATLEDRIGRMAKCIPIKSYSRGERFDPKEYTQGTIAVLRMEMLLGEGVMAHDLDSLAEQDLPEQPTHVTPDYSGNEPFTYLTDGTRQYLSQAMWGVIYPDSLGNNTLYGVGMNRVVRVADGVRSTQSPGPLSILAKTGKLALGRIG